MKNSRNIKLTLWKCPDFFSAWPTMKFHTITKRYFKRKADSLLHRPLLACRCPIPHSPWPRSQCYPHTAEQRNRTKGKLAVPPPHQGTVVMKYLLPWYICFIIRREGIAHHDKGQDFLLHINGQVEPWIQQFYQAVFAEIPLHNQRLEARAAVLHAHVKKL